MNKNTAAARRVLRDRIRAHRTATAVRRGRGRALATHAIVAGVSTETAKGVAGGLRSVAKRLGIKAVRVVSLRRSDNHPGKVRHQYTAAQVATLRANYKPRKAEYKAAVALMALAA